MSAPPRGFVSRTLDAMAPPWSWRGSSDRGEMPSSLHFWANGGLALSEPLARQGTEPPPHVGLVVQPDGDVLLLLPTGFGSQPDDDEAARALFRRARRELAAATRGPLPTGVAALILLGDTALLGVGGLPVANAAADLILRGEVGEVAWLALPLLAAGGRWAAGRFARAWLIDRFLGNARARIAAA